jgi:inorganic pyrophosphatase
MDAQTFKVLIEIPKGTVNEKWEFDHKTGKMVLDFVFENLTWPFNYGEVVGTLGGDGDALDALVFSTEPLEQSAVVDCVPFGLIKMLDRREIDDKLLFVPADDPLSEKYKDIPDFSEDERVSLKNLYAEIARQKKKIIEIKGFLGKKETLEELKNSLV